MSSKVISASASPVQASDSDLETAGKGNVFHHMKKDPETEQGTGDISIRVSNLSKCFHIYDCPQDRLKQSFMPRLRGLFRKTPKQYFREFWALRDISFEVKKGETVGIIGRNGSGKSTLLQIICGTLAPTSGMVETHGRVAALLELGSGFNPEFTGRENVYMNAAVLGLSKGETDACFDDIVAFADIGEFIDQPVKTYSSGMVVRLAFAVIAHVNADILVIDEALSVGDAFFSQKCMRFLRRFQETGTVLFVSHDTSAVTSICTRAILLGKGAVADEGQAKKICQRYLAEQYGEYTGQKYKQLTNEHTDPEESTELVPAVTDLNPDSKSLAPKSIEPTPSNTRFNPRSESFGTGKARIISVDLRSLSGSPLHLVEGGEIAELIIRARAESCIDRPILGFIVKDRLGQYLFGDNTHHCGTKITGEFESGALLEAKFQFSMPFLATGSYSICVSIASGTPDAHVQHHWLHDAFLLEARAHNETGVLVGIPMLNVSFYQVTSSLIP